MDIQECATMKRKILEIIIFQRRRKNQFVMNRSDNYNGDYLTKYSIKYFFEGGKFFMMELMENGVVII